MGYENLMVVMDILNIKTDDLDSNDDVNEVPIPTPCLRGVTTNLD